MSSSIWLSDPSWARTAPAKYRKWSAANGMSAATVSRIGLPLSQTSASASASRLASIRSAILFKIAARSAGAVLPHAGAAAWAASSALSISEPSDRATSQNAWPVTGVTFSKYFPLDGATHSPPMKLPYRDSKDIRAPVEPGRAKTVILRYSSSSGDGVTQLTLPPR